MSVLRYSQRILQLEPTGLASICTNCYLQTFKICMYVCMYVYVYLFDYTHTHTHIYIYVVGDRCRGRPEGSLFNSYYIEVLGRALLLCRDCSTLPLIHTLYCWVLSKEVSSTIFKVFAMTRPGLNPGVRIIGEYCTH